MVERWTRERRLEHTRSLLLDAAEDVFAQKGFAPATLDDIAHAAGYTKGAIYKHFATKEDLFLAVNDRYWRRYFDSFADVMSSAKQVGSRELDEIAAAVAPTQPRPRRRVRRIGPRVHPLPCPQSRRPRAGGREAVRGRRGAREVHRRGHRQAGWRLVDPAVDVRPGLVATSDSVVLGSELDDVDLYRPIVEMYVSAIKLP